MRRTSPLLVSLFALCVFTPAASAASSSAIFQDAADGRIDGTYKLSELRKADSEVSAEQREYYGWDAVYAEAVRRLSNPQAAAKDPVVVPVDSNRNGTIDPAEKAAAQKKEAKLKKKAGASGDDDSGEDDVFAEGADDADSTSSKDGGEDSGDGASPLLWLLILIPLGVIGFGVWRARQGKRERADLDAP